MTSILVSLLLTPALASPLDDGAATELRYSGTLTQIGRKANGTPVKRFSVYALVTKSGAESNNVTYLIDERGGGGWAWPERFGQINLDPQNQPTNNAKIQVLHNHEGTLYPLAVRQPLFEFADKIKEGATWNAGKLAYEVGRLKKVAGRDCRQIEVANSFGRRQAIWVERNSPLVVAAEQRVIMGRGDEFLLRVQLDSIKALDEAGLAAVQKPLNTLLKLKRSLNRRENEAKPELNKTQLAAATAVIARLEKEAESTPFSRLAAVVSRDVKSQSQRSQDVASLSKKFVGQPAPKFTLRTLKNKTIGEKELAGKIVILHFWGYKGDNLVEPYGQVGYLDFLHSRRRKLGVKVIGVAVNSLLEDKKKVSIGLRSVRKLQTFMNLSYDITTDDGTVLRKFGDPRKLGAKLPLWVVIGADGKIAAYKPGFYSIKPDEGLRQLDDTVVALIKKQREK